MRFPRLYQVFFVLIFSITSCESKSQTKISDVVDLKLQEVRKPIYTISEAKISDLKDYLKDKNYNQNLAFFIDFKIPSGKFRFFVCDLKNDEVLTKGLVAHGEGSQVAGSTDLVFSNVEGSYQSSLGKYEIANSYVGNFGKSYKLKGLEKTNNLAMKRYIVLHPYSCVGDEELDGLACLSLGCPMVSHQFLTEISKYIDSSKKPIILYAYY